MSADISLLRSKDMLFVRLISFQHVEQRRSFSFDIDNPLPWLCNSLIVSSRRSSLCCRVNEILNVPSRPNSYVHQSLIRKSDRAGFRRVDCANTAAADDRDALTQCFNFSEIVRREENRYWWILLVRATESSLSCSPQRADRVNESVHQARALADSSTSRARLPGVACFPSKAHQNDVARLRPVRVSRTDL